jgi:GntR family transcriptional regulator of vanillate catabolism
MIMMPYPSPDNVSPTRTSAITAQLRELLLQGAFAPNSRLYEANLAQRLGVSRTPVRDALNTLAQEGLVTYFPNRGYQVRACAVEDVLGSFVVRGTLEALAASLAARNGLSVYHRARLMDSTESSAKLLEKGNWREDSGKRWRIINAEFHSCVIDAAGNNALSRAIADTLRMPILDAGGGARWFTRDELVAFLDYKAVKVSHDEHCLIFEALLKRDEVSAAEIMRKHIQRASDLFEAQWLRGIGDKPAVGARPRRSTSKDRATSQTRPRVME